MKKFTAILLSCAMAFGLLSGCSSSDSGSTITIGATPAPHAEILEVAKEILAEQGITLEIVVFNDYIQPNTSLDDGSLDANYFQHITYMNEFNDSYGINLVAVDKIHYEPFGLYAGQVDSMDALTEGAQIAVPNDPTDEARALLLLEQEGLITLADGAGILATKTDIVENPLNLDIIELEAAQIPVRLEDVAMACINGNYAIDAGLSISDALAIESDDGTAADAYANVIAVNEGNEDNEDILALVEVLKGDEVRAYIAETYDDAVIAVD